MNGSEMKTQNRTGTDDPLKTVNPSLFRRGCAWFLLAVLFLLCAFATAVSVVDPFFVYHAPLKNFPYVIDNQSAQNPGMARHMEYDAFLTGSSMTFNFDMNDFETKLGLHTLKLSYAGAYPHDEALIMDVVFEKPDVQAAFLSVELPTLTGEVSETKYPVPWYLRDKNPLNDAPYLLGKDVFLQYVMKPLIHPEPTPLNTVYADTWRTDDWYGTDRVMEGFTLTPKAEFETDAQSLIALCEKNLDANYLPYIEAHPQTTFYLFYPAYSMLYWYNLGREKRLEATLAEVRYVTERFLRYENVRVFCFADDTDYITDLDNYGDYTHHKPEYNRHMVSCFADGTREIKTMEDADASLQRLRTMVGTYDFDALFDAYGIGTD